MKRAGGRVLLVGLSLLVSGGLAEGIYRATQASDDAPDGFDDGWRQRYIRLNETLYQRSDDAELVYQPVPGSSVEMEYGPTSFNMAGMRMDREVSEAHGGGTRVAVLGDSLVWSEFLPAHDAIPQRLDEALGEGWEVLNFGVSGYDTTQEAAWYERHIRRFGADVVVVVWCMNDMMIMSGPFERFANDSNRARKDAQESLMERVAPVRRETIDRVVAQQEREATFKLWARLQGMLARARFDADYVDEYLVMQAQPERAAQTEAAIARLGSAIRADDARPVFVISPVLEAWEDYHWLALHAWVRRHAEQAGFEVVDLLDAWRDTEDPETMRISGDNLHYDGSGSRLFAETVARSLRDPR